MPSFFKNKISQALGAVDSFVGNIGNEVNSVIDTFFNLLNERMPPKTEE